MQELLIIGGGGHCCSCIEVIESQNKFQIKGIVGLRDEVGKSVLGYPVLGCDDDLPQLISQCPLAVVGAGQIKSPSLRLKLYRQLIELGAELPSIVASSAIVSRHAQIGCGTIVMHGAIVNARAIVGVNGIINTRALIEHDASVGDHCHISTAAVLNGHVQVGDMSFVGSGAIVHQCVRIGRRAIIAAGAVVDQDIEENAVARTGLQGERTKNRA